MSRGKIIIAGPCSRTAFVAFLVLTTVGALATASAQPADIKAIDKAFQDHYARGNYPAAQTDAQELERLAKGHFGADHPYYAVVINKLALVYWKRGRYSESEALLKRALAIRETALGANHPAVGQSLNNLAIVYADQRKYGEAEELYKRALAIREQALGANHGRPQTAPVHHAARRRGRDVAARGPRAANGNAGDRVSQSRVGERQARPDCRFLSRIS
jgi:tetratricopeptide (TPR) repeat protein